VEGQRARGPLEFGIVTPLLVNLAYRQVIMAESGNLFITLGTGEYGYEHLNSEGMEFANEIEKAILPVLQRWYKRGYGVHDMLGTALFLLPQLSIRFIFDKGE
jgi:hypothetical protein